MLAGSGIQASLAQYKSQRVECLRPLLMGVKHVDWLSNIRISFTGSSPVGFTNLFLIY